MLRAAMALSFFSSQVLAHPGHGALEIHWHLDDLAWVLLGAMAVVGIGFLIVRKKKR